MRQWPGWNRAQEPALAMQIRDAAYDIIRRKGATNHAIGLATADLLRALLRDERRVLTVSRVHDGTQPWSGVALSMPTVVAGDGAIDVLEPEMDGDERRHLTASAAVLRSALARVEVAAPTAAEA